MTNMDEHFQTLEDEEIDEYHARVRNYIMVKLHPILWHKGRVQHIDDIKYRHAISNLQWIKPEYLVHEKPDITINLPMWNECIVELNQMDCTDNSIQKRLLSLSKVH